LSKGWSHLLISRSSQGQDKALMISRSIIAGCYHLLKTYATLKSCFGHAEDNTYWQRLCRLAGPIIWVSVPVAEVRFEIANNKGPCGRTLLYPQ
jgi:hypothetical protein